MIPALSLKHFHPFHVLRPRPPQLPPQHIRVFRNNRHPNENNQYLPIAPLIFRRVFGGRDGFFLIAEKDQETDVVEGIIEHVDGEDVSDEAVPGEAFGVDVASGAGVCGLSP